MDIGSAIKSIKQNTNFLTYQFDLIWHLVKREFNIQYKRSVLGVFWYLLLPLGQLLVLIFVFQRIIPLKIEVLNSAD